MREIKRIFVHCTAGRQDQSAGSLLKYFLTVVRWMAPGYHFVVEDDGTVKNIWPVDKIANGVKGYNSTAIHVAWTGGIDANGQAIDNRTSWQCKALRDLLKELHAKYPDAEILGHRDISPDKNGNGIVDPWERIKECPCFDIKSEYKDFI